MKVSNELLKQMQEKTESIRKHIADYESGDKMNYWCHPTSWMKEAAKHGAENIFMVGKSYRSHAYDDYATFTYYNQATMEEFTDSWTTAGACPSYSLYECMTIEEAFRKGLLDEEKYVRFRKEISLKYLESYHCPSLSVDDFIKYKVRVEVTGGRKWKGIGYALSSKWVSFGYHQTKYVSILDPETNLVHEISDRWVHPAEDIETAIPQYREWAKAKIAAVTPDALRMGDRGLYVEGLMFNFYDWLEEKAKSVELDMSKAVNPAQDERDRRKADFKTRKMADLVEWVKKNTDKQGDAILQLAEHIFQKRYA